MSTITAFVTAVMIITTDGQVQQDVGVFKEQAECAAAYIELRNTLEKEPRIATWVITPCQKATIFVKVPGKESKMF